MATNQDRLVATLATLGSLRTEVVLLGGASTQLLITDPAAAGAGPTDDVDLIVDCDAMGFHAFEARLRTRGFTQRPENDDPICRWRRGDIKIDVVPIDEKLLGFSSRWYRHAWDTAEVHVVAGQEIRVVTATMFVTTKLDAFDDRGGGDYQRSKDLEDVVAVVDGRPELVDEVAHAPADVRAYLADRIGRLLADDAFVDAVDGHLAGDHQRLPIVVDRLRRRVALTR